LAALGGAAKIQDVPRAGNGTEPAWGLIPVGWHPALSLKRAREDYPIWETNLKGLNPDGWSKLYYALSMVESPVEQDAVLWFSGWDGCRLWVNGQLAFEEHSYHHAILDMEKISFKLKRGVNTFLFQLDRDGAVARIEIPGQPEALKKLRSVT